MTNAIFPKDFYFGAATSAYQIEGAWDADGKGESVWDRFTHTPGKIEGATNGDVACDHYHRWQGDVQLMGSLGLNAYRFSISWPRIIPAGRGAINQAGIDFYSRLVDGLLESGITPFPTLFHWDLPQALQEQGGFAARSTTQAFAEYSAVITRALGDRVKHWITLNEPSVFAFLGYGIGVHAPGLKNMAVVPQVAHHLLLAHGLSMQAIRANCPGAQAGIALNINYGEPASPSAADYDAWRMESGPWVRMFTDPLYGRHYPADIVAEMHRSGGLAPDGMDFVQPGDLGTIATQTDFLGVNYYTRRISRSQSVPEEQNLPQTRFPSGEIMEMEGWEDYPQGLFKVLSGLHYNYQIPALYVTENGASYSDGPDASGQIHDERRLRYLKGHLAACAQAIACGVPLKGYFYWSLLDNFEWGHGFGPRFGLAWVDYASQQRTLKASALWYAEYIKNQSEK